MDHAAHVRKALTKHRLTDIARASGLPKTTIHSIKTGASTRPQYETIKRLEVALVGLDLAAKAKPSEKTAKTKAQTKPATQFGRDQAEASALWATSTSVYERQCAVRGFDLAKCRRALELADVAPCGLQPSIRKTLESRIRRLEREQAAAE